MYIFIYIHTAPSKYNTGMLFCNFLFINSSKVCITALVTFLLLGLNTATRNNVRSNAYFGFKGRVHAAAGS